MNSMFEPSDLMENGRGRWKTRSLFKEVCRPEDEPIFSWSKDRNNGLINIRDLFIQWTIDDPSEATFAEMICGDVGWWEEVKETTWIRAPLNEWRKVASVKRKAKAFRAIVKEVEENGRSSFTAAKYLIEEPWKDKRDRRVKANTKETTEEAYKQVHSDVARLRENGFLDG